MGDLINSKIHQTRSYYDPNAVAGNIDYDYDNVYPKTVYDAIRRSFDETSTTLTDEIAAIYREISEKQPMIGPGVSGNIMTWSGANGSIGSLDVTKYINTINTSQSNSKIPTEKAVGDALEQYTKSTSFNDHVNDSDVHVTISDKSKWDDMVPNSTFEAHINNSILHLTDDERKLWNSKADGQLTEDHIYDNDNPHNVSAHQVGAYTREEVDIIIENIRESFFNRKNIIWNDTTYIAELSDYDTDNWNPNYVFAFNSTLPDVDDATATYFALIPDTDHTIDESDVCQIWAKLPGYVWQHVGSANMAIGDMVVTYPDSQMYAWTNGQWVRLLDGSSTLDDNTVNGEYLWKPVYDSDTSTLSFELSNDYDTPNSFVIESGYTPVKGVDYFDGDDGAGVPIGGMTGEILVKSSNTNFDTKWKTIAELFEDLVLNGDDLPESLIVWDGIKNRPEWYDELGDNSDGFITQRAATSIYNTLLDKHNELLDSLYDSGDFKLDELIDHMSDYSNPHKISAAQIGAATVIQLTEHVSDTDNPHNVTKDQVGLSNVDNTSDADKPVSDATQKVIDAINDKITILSGDSELLPMMTDCNWDNDNSRLIFDFSDDTQLLVTIPLIETFQNIYYDAANKDLVIKLPNGTENRLDISNLIAAYTGSTNDHIEVTIDVEGKIFATIIPSTITGNELISSIELRGHPTAVTQSVGNRSTRLATTEFVANEVIDNLISYENDRALSANMGRILNENKLSKDQVVDLLAELTAIDIIDNLESTNPYKALSANMGRELDLTKAPRIHTSDSGSTFGRATISLFGHTRASEVDPLMDGTVFRGTDDGRYARSDHRHPTDITRAPIHWPDLSLNQYEMTGEPKAVTPPDDSNNTRIATTEWIRRNAVGVNKGWCATAGAVPIKEVFLMTDYAGFNEDDTSAITYSTGVAFTMSSFSMASYSATEIAIPVTGIEGISLVGTVGEVFIIEATVNPPDATEQNIEYYIEPGSLGGAYIVFNDVTGNYEIHGVTEPGTLTLNAVVVDGLISGSTGGDGGSTGGDSGSTGGDGGSTGGDSGSTGGDSGSTGGDSGSTGGDGGSTGGDSGSTGGDGGSTGGDSGSTGGDGGSTDSDGSGVRGDVVFNRSIGSTVVVTFKEGDISSIGTTFMDVNGTGPARITYGGYDISSDMIKSYHTYIFVWNGYYWTLQNPSGMHPIPLGDNSNSIATTKWVNSTMQFQPMVRFAQTCTTASSENVKEVWLLDTDSSNTATKPEYPSTYSSISSVASVMSLSSPISTMSLSDTPTVMSTSTEPVTGITNIPTTGIVGEDLILHGYEISPSNATNDGVEFRIDSSSVGGDVVFENGVYKVKNVTGEGTIKMTMTVINGNTYSDGSSTGGDGGSTGGDGGSTGGDGGSTGGDSGSTGGDGGSTGGDSGSTGGDGGSTGGDGGSTGGGTVEYLDPPLWEPDDANNSYNEYEFVLVPGFTIAVPFKYEDKSSGITKLNVNGIGDMTIWDKGIPLSNGMIGESYTHWFTYDGAGHWHIINPVASVVGSEGSTFP